MTSLQVQAELFHQLSLIAEDENKMKRALKALKRIAAPKSDPTEMTQEEYFARLNQASKGKSKSFANIDDLDRYIQSL